MKRVAIIGIQGVPAAYGGFETLVENLIGDNCPADVRYTVFCSRPDCAGDSRVELPREYKGATLRYLPLSSHGIQSIPYDILSMLCALRGYDVTVVLGTSGCSFLPVFRLFNRRRLIVNIDGLEHRREKWGRMARTILRFSEQMAVRTADVVIADNRGICDYVVDTYGKTPALIAYGGDHAVRELSDDFVDGIMRRYKIERGNYAVSVCRIEPENNCHVTLEAFSHCPDRNLVFVGNWDNSDYGRDLKIRYGRKPNMRLLDSIYDLDTLCALRSGASLYVHGHSAGGTNPSLVEAMFTGIPVLTFDVVYNRATTCDAAYYYSNAAELEALLHRNDLDGAEMRRIAERDYRWSHIAAQYAALY